MSDYLELEGKRALVTGGTKGVGQAVVATLRDAGATVLDGCGLRGASLVDDRLVLEADGVDPVTARYAIGADGMWSPLRKALAAGDGTEPAYLINTPTEHYVYENPDEFRVAPDDPSVPYDWSRKDG